MIVYIFILLLVVNRLLWYVSIVKVALINGGELDKKSKITLRAMLYLMYEKTILPAIVGGINYKVYPIKIGKIYGRAYKEPVLAGLSDNVIVLDIALLTSVSTIFMFALLQGSASLAFVISSFILIWSVYRTWYLKRSI